MSDADVEDGRRERRKSKRAKVSPGSKKMPSRAIRKKLPQAKMARSPTLAAQGGAILKFMQELPLDVLLEIFSHLQPADLIHLSRTTKALRSIMMRRSARTIWTQALSSIPDLPPCPDDLIEAQYANLMFTDYCHECLATNDDNPSLVLFMFMEARTQLCHTCAPKKFKAWDSFTEVVSEDLVEFIPATAQSFSKNAIGRPSGTGAFKYSIDIATQLQNEYVSLVGKDKEDWISQQRKRWSAVSVHAEDCEAYVLQREEQERLRLRIVEGKRMKQIIQRLKELGMGKELDLPGVANQLGRHPLVMGRYKNTISRGEWEEIDPELLEWAEARKAERLLKGKELIVERRIKEFLYPIYGEYLASHPPQIIHPSAFEVALIEEIRSQIEDTPLEDDLKPSDAMLDVCHSKLAEFVESWHANHDEVLMDKIRQSKVCKGQKVTRGTLLRATSVFECNYCGKGSLIYPDVLLHSCNFEDFGVPQVPRPSTSSAVGKGKRKRQQLANETIGDRAEETLPAPLIRRVIKDVQVVGQLDNISLSEGGYYHTVALLETIGFKIETTAEKLKRVEPGVEGLCACYFVQPPSKNRMTWPELLECSTRHRRGGYSDCYKLAKDQNARSKAEEKGLTSPAEPRKICAICNMGMSTYAMHRHLSVTHGMATDMADKITSCVMSHP